MKISNSEKVILIILILIISPTIAYFNTEKIIDLEKILKFLALPALVIGLILAIVINVYKVKGKFNIPNSPYSKQLSIPNDEPLLLNLGFRFIFRLTGYKIPALYLFSKTIVTNERIDFRLIPFLPFPTFSIFFNFKSDNTQLLKPTKIAKYRMNTGSINIYTDNGEFIKIFISKENLAKLDTILKNNLVARQ